MDKFLFTTKLYRLKHSWISTITLYGQLRCNEKYFSRIMEIYYFQIARKKKNSISKIKWNSVTSRILRLITPCTCVLCTYSSGSIHFSFTNNFRWLIWKIKVEKPTKSKIWFKINLRFRKRYKRKFALKFLVLFSLVQVMSGIVFKIRYIYLNPFKNVILYN